MQTKHLLSIIALGAVAATAHGASVPGGSARYGTGSGGAEFQTTNWSQALVADLSNGYSGLEKFDSTLGTLNSISYEIEVSIRGTGKGENEGAGSVTITLNFEADFEFPDLGTLGLLPLTLTPLSSAGYPVATYDGTTDFAGASGTGVQNFDATLSYQALDAGTTGTITPGSHPFFPWASYQAPGGGPLTYVVDATGTSGATGGGNLASGFTQSGYAELTLTYNYTPVSTEVPEASSVLGAFGVVGLGGLAFFRRRLSAKA